MRFFNLLKGYVIKNRKSLLNFLLITNMLVVFTFLTIENASASDYSKNERISLSIENGTVYDVLKTIEKNSEFKFLYQNEQIDINRLVSIDVANESIENILERVFGAEMVKTQILEDNLIVLTSAKQQKITITGTVTNSAGEPLPGVNIIEKGTTNGVVSNLDGNYTITVTDQNSILEFSFLGYNTSSVVVGSQTQIDVPLADDFEELEEVVVVGYGQMKKSDLTGSVGSLDEDAITERSVNNPMEALQGNVAGVSISSSTGRLGDSYNISIRGKNSLNDDAGPLYIIDGVASEGMDHLNPQDIARIDILKDASSTAIYGSRGSNGVVIVSTKSGANAPKGVNVSFDSYYGIKKPTRLPDMMDGKTWWAYHQAAYLGDDPMGITAEGLSSSVANIKAGYPAPYGRNEYLIKRAENNETFDWYDAVLQNGMMANNYVSISGSGDNVSYNFGVGAQNETGLIDKESLDKYSIKAGFNSKVSDMITIGTNITFTRASQERGNSQAMLNAFRFSPLMTPYAPDGKTLFAQPGKLQDEDEHYYVDKTSTWNPILDIQNASDLTQRTNIVTSSFAQVKPLEWLSFKTTFSVGYDNKDRGQSWGAETEIGHNKGDMPVAQVTKTYRLNYTWDNQFNIDYTVDDHKFSFLGLQSIYSDKGERTYQYANQMPFETGAYNVASGAQSSYVFYPANADDPDFKNLVPYYQKQTLASFALRLNYSYKGKYLVTFSNRWDGSSVLSEGNKWAAFPSGALAWRMSEEAFMKSQEIVSRLKVRVSMGYTGNNAVKPYSSLNQLDKQIYYTNGSGSNEKVYAGWLPSSLANPELTWERTRELNFGFDYGIFKNRISGTLDIYDRLSDDILMQEELPLETGRGKYNANIGSISNRGIELGLTTVNVRNDLITWETSFIFSKNTNEIKSIHGQSEFDDIGNGWFIGESIDAEYNYEFDGIVQKDEDGLYGLNEGMAKVKDLNHDGKITASDDRKVLGSKDPDWTGSFNTKLKVANFDLSLSMITSQGVFVYSPFHSDFLETYQRGRQKLNVQVYVPENGAGLPTNFSNKYPRPRAEGTYWQDSDVGYYKDASFTKIKNITLGYTIPEEVLSKVFIKSFRVYFNVIDPFVWTDYDGYDPEWASASRELGRVASVTYQMGLNLKF